MAMGTNWGKRNMSDVKFLYAISMVVAASAQTLPESQSEKNSQVLTSPAKPPSLIFAIVPLVFVIIVLLMALAFFIVRIGNFLASRHRGQETRLPSISEQNNLDEAAHAMHFQQLSDTNHLYRHNIVNLSDRENTVNRTDSMVRRAALWAQTMLSGDADRSLRGNRGAQHRGWDSNRWSSSSSLISTRKPCIVANPDGKKVLGILCDVICKDVCIGVTENDINEWMLSNPDPKFSMELVETVSSSSRGTSTYDTSMHTYIKAKDGDLAKARRNSDGSTTCSKTSENRDHSEVSSVWARTYQKKASCRYNGRKMHDAACQTGVRLQWRSTRIDSCTKRGYMGITGKRFHNALRWAEDGGSFHCYWFHKSY